MTTICDEIWQPFFSKGLLNHPEAMKFLVDISTSLAKVKSYREAIWRETTLQEVESYGDSTTSEDFLKSVVQNIMDKVRPLLDQMKIPSIKNELRKLCIEAMEFWANAQKDGSRIKAIMTPSQDKVGWEEALSSVFPGHSTKLILSTSSSAENYKALVLFPEIVRTCQPDSQGNPTIESSNETPQPRVLHNGWALFPETDIFHAGAEEKAEEVRQRALAQSGSFSNRSPTMTVFSPLSGTGIPVNGNIVQSSGIVGGR